MTTEIERIKIITKVDRAKVIAGVGLLGGVILLLYGLFMTRIYATGELVVFKYIHAIVTILWALMAICSSVLLLRGYKVGYVILLIAAIGGIIGSFIPIYSFYYDPYGYGYGYTQIIYLNGTTYFDVVIMLIGGIYGVALMENKERKE